MATDQPAQAKAAVQCHHQANILQITKTNTNNKDKDGYLPTNQLNSS